MKKQVSILGFILAIATTVFANTSQQQMQLKLVDPVNGQLDLTSVYFAGGTNPTYTSPEDAQKSLNPDANVPQLYSFSSDNIACYSNGYGNFNATTVIALGMRASADTTYILSLAGSTYFDAATLILLEDRQLGTFTNLRNSSYTLHTAQAGGVDNRFYLHVTFPPAVTALASGCNNNSGMVTVTEDSSVQWSSCTLVDSIGNVVKTNHNITGTFTFGGLPEGPYNVVFVYNTYQSVKTAQVDGHRIELGISASFVHAAVGEVIDFFSTASNSTNYLWQLGDSTEITGIANPSYAYGEDGNYMVTLRASNNYACSASASINVYISSTTAVSNVATGAIMVTNDNHNLRIDVADASSNNYNYELYNISGQLLRTGAVTSPGFEVSLSGMASGIYLVSVKGGQGTYTKKIVVGQ